MPGIASTVGKELVAHKLSLQGLLRGVQARLASCAQQARIPAEFAHAAAAVPSSDMAVRAALGGAAEFAITAP